MRRTAPQFHSKHTSSATLHTTANIIIYFIQCWQKRIKYLHTLFYHQTLDLLSICIFFQIHHILFLFLTILIQSYIHTCMINKLCFTSQIFTIIIQFIVHNSWGRVKKICTWNYKNRWHFSCFVSFMSLVWIWIKSF